MDTVLSMLVLIGLGAVVGTLVGYTIRRGDTVVGRVFGLRRRDDWPPGVEEDDSPPPWKLRPPSKPSP